MSDGPQAVVTEILGKVKEVDCNDDKWLQYVKNLTTFF